MTEYAKPAGYPAGLQTCISSGSFSKNRLYFFNGTAYNEARNKPAFTEGGFYMGFWIFMLLMDLIIPFTMIGFGRHFMKSTPKEINALFGYRTSMSMKNQDTWDFAHKYCGKIWYTCGLILLPVTVLCLLLAIGKSIDFVGTAGGIICGAQLIPLAGSVIPTEIALKKIFDKNGKRR